MTEQFDAKAVEIRAMFNHQLDPESTAEIRELMLAARLANVRRHLQEA